MGGCGFGAEGDADRLSRAEYSERGRSLCDQTRADLERTEGSVEQTVGTLRRLLSELKRLDPPAELEAEAYRFEAAFERQLDVAGDSPSTRGRGIAPPADQLDELTDFALESDRAAREAERLARAAGLASCGGF